MPVSDEVFLKAWRETGGRARLVAEMFGMSLRNVYRRRNSVEEHLSARLSSAGDSAAPGRGDNGAQPNEYLQRVAVDGFHGTVVVFSDCHYWPDQKPSIAHKALVNVVRDIKPQLLIGNGDLFDGARLSRFPRNGWEYQPLVKDELAEAQTRLAEVRHAYSRARCIRTVGNHCYDEGTECLTHRGWMRWNEIRDTDLVLSMVGEHAVWSPILERISYRHTGEMVSIKNQAVNALITPGHRVLLERLNWRTGKYDIREYRTADDLPYGFNIPMSAEVQSPGISTEDDVLRLLGWVMTDGSYDNGSAAVTIHQSKPAGIEKIRSLLSRLSIPYRESSRQRSATEVCGRKLKMPSRTAYDFRIPAEYGRKIRRLLPEKHTIPAWMGNLTRTQFEVFLGAVFDGDGTWSRGGNGGAVYGRREFLSQLQALASQKGWRARLAENNRGNFLLWLNRYSRARVERKHVARVGYDGMVWCLSVPHTNFMVRRNGSAYFSGNCIRFDRFLSVNSGAMEAVPGMRLADHLPAWKECVSVFINGHTMVKHRFHGGIHAAYNNTLRSGTNIVTGHTHHLEVKPWGDYRGRRYGVQTGAIADVSGPQFAYTEDNPTPWCSGFAVLTFDKSGRLLPPELAEVIQGKCYFRGAVVA